MPASLAASTSGAVRPGLTPARTRAAVSPALALNRSAVALASASALSGGAFCSFRTMLRPTRIMIAMTRKSASVTMSIASHHGMTSARATAIVARANPIA